MEITVPYIQGKFNEFNEMIFGGKLPPIPVRLSDAKTFLGQIAYKKRRLPDGRIERSDFVLRINTRISLSERELEDTIIHEMIHYCIYVNKIEDTSAHGKAFVQLMNLINTRFGRHITITHDGSAVQKAQAVDKRARYHVIAVVTFHDGRTGIKVLPRVVQSILKYYNGTLSVPEVKEVKLYMSNNPFFNQYPNSSAFKVYWLSQDEITTQLKGAQHMPCDGRRITYNP